MVIVTSSFGKVQFSALKSVLKKLRIRDGLL